METARSLGDALARRTRVNRSIEVIERSQWEEWAICNVPKHIKNAFQAEIPVWLLEADEETVRGMRRIEIFDEARKFFDAARLHDTDRIWGPGNNRWEEDLERAQTRLAQRLLEMTKRMKQIPTERERKISWEVAQAAGKDNGETWTIPYEGVEALARLKKSTREGITQLGGWRTRIVCETSDRIDLEADSETLVMTAIAATARSNPEIKNERQRSAVREGIGQWEWTTMRPPIKVMWALGEHGIVINDETGWGAAIAIKEDEDDEADSVVSRWRTMKEDVKPLIEKEIRTIAAQRLANQLGTNEEDAHEALDRLEILWKGTDEASKTPGTHLEADTEVGYTMVWKIPLQSAARVIGLNGGVVRENHSDHLMHYIRKTLANRIKARKPRALTTTSRVRRPVPDKEGEVMAQRWGEAMATLKNEAEPR